MKPVVYLIEFPDGATYVGATTNFSSRRTAHLRVAKGRGKPTNSKLAAHLRQFPVCGIYVIASGFDRETLHQLEAQVIADRQPTLNIKQRPTPLPGPEASRCRPWGEYTSLAQASRDLRVPYRSIKRLAAEFGSYDDVLKARKSKPRATELAAMAASLSGQKSVRDPDAQKVRHGGVLDYPKNHAERYGGTRTSYRKWRAKLGSLEAALDYLANRGTPVPQPPRYITADGATRTLAEWSRLTGIKVGTIRSRLDVFGWTPEQAVGMELTPYAAFMRDRRAARQPKEPT